MNGLTRPGLGDPLHWILVETAVISLDLGRHVVADCQAGHTVASMARKCIVSGEQVRLFSQRFERTGEVGRRFGVWHGKLTAKTEIIRK